MLVSLVVPVLNEENNVPALWQRLVEVTTQLPEQFEVVFVDDGSTDDTPRQIEALQPAPKIRWKLVQFSRNLGHQAAISAGMEHASGDAIAFLDADLQDPPELLPG